MLLESMLRLTLPIAAAIFVVWAARKTCLRSLSAKKAALLWLPIVLQLMIPFPLQIEITQRQSEALPIVLKESTALLQRPQPSRPLIFNPIKEGEKSVSAKSDPLAALTRIWQIGMLVQLVVLAAQAKFAAIEMKKSGKALPPEAINEDLRQLDLPKRKIVLPQFRGAAITSTVPSVLIVQENWQSLKPDQWELLLKHESAHWRAHHCAIRRLLRGICWLWWFHPAVWLMRSILLQELEYWADETVLKSAPQAKQRYASLLIELQNPDQRFGELTLSKNGRKTKERLVKMMEKKTTWKLFVPAAAGLGLIVAVLLIQMQVGKGMDRFRVSPDPIADEVLAPVSLDADGTVEELIASLSVPLDYPVITCGWGCYDGHIGSDVKNDVDRYGSVYAAQDGVVVKTGSNKEAGNYIVIDHGQGIVTRYEHLSEILCQQEETVGQGSVIGKIGMSGMATGPHLHFSLWIDGEAVNADALFEGE